MPTVFSHVAVPLALGAGLGRRVVPRRLLVAAVAAAMIPDLDVIGWYFGVGWGSILSHRGFTHSIGFSLLLAALACVAAPWLHSGRALAAAFVGISALSHPLLDMATTGGYGVALWWPLSEQRVAAPPGWRVIEISPISIERFLSARGLRVLQSELAWVWLPAAALAASIGFGRWLWARPPRVRSASG
ncbi:MAG TPA: metal-dependent hydrolase [Burkholderiaceae bacterium]|nr:metal-dependent hydrolase [Burkholderiaceae bacterium]